MSQTASAPPSPTFFQSVTMFLERFGNVVGRALMTVIYFVAVAPVAIVYQLFTDKLMVRKGYTSTYVDWSQVNETVEDAQRQD